MQSICTGAVVLVLAGAFVILTGAEVGQKRARHLPDVAFTHRGIGVQKSIRLHRGR